MARLALIGVVIGVLVPRPVVGQVDGVRDIDDSVTIRFVDTDLRAVVQALGRYLPKPVLSANLPATPVTVETPQAIPRGDVALILKGLVESQNLAFEEDSTFIRIGPRPEPPRTPSGGDDALGRVPVHLEVVRLKHARAADVAATVNQLFGGGGEFSGSRSLQPTLSDELRRGRVAPAGAEGQPEAAGPNPGTSALRGPVVIVPDELTNSLLIRASEGDFAVLREAIDALDIRPLQVVIEVLIVEARSDNSFSLGTDLFVPQQDIGQGGSVGGEVTGGGLGDMVVRLLNLGKANIDATLNLAQRRGNVKIISRPVLVTANNTEARFLVGSQRPFVQVSRSLPTDAPSRDQVIQYKDVGTKLTILPTINQDGYVSLLVQQEINAATNEVQFDAPVISTREASTQVLVRDGQTIVLGGLRDQQRDRVQSGIPILSGIPIIGGLFGSASRRSTATELYIFLTPTILATDEDVDAASAERLLRTEFGAKADTSSKAPGSAGAPDAAEVDP